MSSDLPLKRSSVLFNKVRAIWNDKSHLFWYVVFLSIVAVAFFFIVLVRNSLTIPLSGDYCLQQIPFYTNGYDDWWRFIRTGDFPLWDQNTFLGANNIGANSFYYLLNPFFLPILLFPRDYIAQGLAFLMIVKMILAGLTFRMYLKSIGLKESTSRLFALAYAFCGWNVFYLWFNHFLEVAVVFPLILMGIERVIRYKKPWLLMGSLFLMGLCNYFFLVSSCFCGVLYAGYRYFSLWKYQTSRDRWQVLLLGFSGFLVGLMMASLTLFPSYAVVIHSPRVEEATYLERLEYALNAMHVRPFIRALFSFDYKMIALEGMYVREYFDGFWKLLTSFNSEKQTYYPLMSFLFPTISDYSSILFNNRGYDNTLSSLFVYTPLMMFFVPSVLQSLRRRRVRHCVALAFFLAALFTPFFYYLCYGFTLAYGRWQIFAVTALLVFLARNYEERKTMPKWYFDVSIGVLLIGVIIVVSYALSIQGNLAQYSVYELGERIFVVIGEVLYMFVVYGVLRFQFRKKYLTRLLTFAVSIEAVVMGTLTFNFQPPNDYSNVYGGLGNVQEEERIIRAIQEEDEGFYRIFNTNADRSSNNLGMRENYRGISAFHSVYNYNLFDFVTWSRITYSYRNWSMGVHEKRYNLDTLLNVKYYIQKASGNYISTNIPLGYHELEELREPNHRVYQNDNFVELGFAFDRMFEAESFSFYDVSDLNEIAYLSGAVVEEEDREQVSALMGYDVPVYNVLELEDIAEVPLDFHRVNTIAHLEYTQEKARYQQYAEAVLQEDPTLSDEEVAEVVKERYGFDIALYADRNIVGSVSDYTYGSSIIMRNNVSTVCQDSTGCYLSLRLRSDNQFVEIFEVDEEGNRGELLVSDNHMYHYYDTTGDWDWRMRGYYLPRAAENIEISIRIYRNYNNRNLPYPTLYAEPYSTYRERIELLQAEPLQDIEVSDNEMTFATDYQDPKIVVLSVPYDEGWKAEAQMSDGEVQEVSLFKMQGGFLGFVSPSGTINYHFRYETPNLKEAIILCVTGLAIFGSTWAAVYVCERRKKHRRFIDQFTLLGSNWELATSKTREEQELRKQHYPYI